MAQKIKGLRRITKALDRVLKRIETPDESLERDEINYVIFSDQHRGQRDGADDFNNCERAYHAALGYYYEKGYTLVVLGDVEELWQCRPRKVIQAYPETYRLEREFFEAGRYIRVFGNHDDHWRYSRAVRRQLWPQYGETLTVSEGHRLEVTEQGKPLGTIFFVHGHQGTLDADILGHVSRILVRLIWRPFQRMTRLPSTKKTPAEHFGLRQSHNTVMYLWALGRIEGEGKLILVAGHTHKPVFIRPLLIEEYEAHLENARKDPSSTIEDIAEQRAELEYVRAQERFRFSELDPELRPPKQCYFNTGCCIYGDGDVTGIEISEGEIKLVKWSNGRDGYQLEVKAKADLRDIFTKL